MMRDIAVRVLDSVRSRMGSVPRLVSVDILGKKVRVRKGTTRPEPDYDDAWFTALARRDGVVFDVGANVGYTALLAALSGPARLCVLVEANVHALLIAAENLVRNSLSDNAHFVNAFAGDTDDQDIELWTVGAGAAGSMFRSHAITASARGKSIHIPSITLDSLAEQYGVVPDLIKIDVEGAEVKVLRGARTIAGHSKARFLVEMHSNPDLTMAQNTADVLQWCMTVGYSAWYLKEEKRLDAPDRIAHRGRCHLLLQPAEWSYPSSLHGIGQSAALDAAIAH